MNAQYREVFHRQIKTAIGSLGYDVTAASDPAGVTKPDRRLPAHRRGSIAAHTEIIIRSSPEPVWDFASDPRNWTASNPAEHFGLRYDNPENRPATGVTFSQRESVGGVFGELRGRILYAKRPEVAAWAGIASYRLLGGLLRLRIPEGGLLRLESCAGETKLSHDVFMDFPPTLIGRVAFRWFKRLRRGEKAVYDHTFRELEFFKAEIEKSATAAPTVGTIGPSSLRAPGDWFWEEATR